MDKYAELPRPCRLVCWIPGHALHEEGLQRQIGVGPQVSSQERTAAVVPLINRSSTGYRVPPFGLNKIYFVRASAETSRRVVFGALGAKLTIVSWAHRPAAVPSRHAPPCRDPPRPALPAPLALPCLASPVVCPGFGFDT